jgi:release factor glutamine methyltransferase
MVTAEVAAPSTSAGAAVNGAVVRLRAAGSPTPRLDAELLVGHVLDRDRAWLLAHEDAPITVEAETRLRRLVDRRAAGEPVAYLRGFKEWYGMRLATDQRALIPRPETELLVDLAVTEVATRLTADDRPILVWDVGTGSGAVAVALARRFRAALALGRVRLIASDVSPDAVELAAENLSAHGVDRLVVLQVADLLQLVGQDAAPPDVVVANLPYVPAHEVDVGTGSLAWEPRAALDGGPDGLDVVRRLVDRLPDHLLGGVALLEIGAGQAAQVRTVVDDLPGRWSQTVAPDLAGHERILVVRRER